MKKSLPIAEILAIKLFVQSYTVSLGNFGLTFFSAQPPTPDEFFCADLFSYNIPNTSSYVHNIFVYFCRFSILLHMSFFKKASEL